jgi:hypothetical protein
MAHLAVVDIGAVAGLLSVEERTARAVLPGERSVSTGSMAVALTTGEVARATTCPTAEASQISSTTGVFTRYTSARGGEVHG